MNTELTQDWYFTFGFGHAHPNCYVKIHGTFGGAREEMFRRYGDKWAFQYDAAKALSSIERFNMKEITPVEQVVETAQQLEDQIRYAKGDTTELRSKLAALRAVISLPHACCEKATVSESAVAYAYAYECPVHGPTRIGSSD